MSQKLVVKNIIEPEAMVLAPGKVLLRAVEKKNGSSLNLITPAAPTTTAADAMQEAYIEYAEVINANGCKGLEDGDIIVLANYSAQDAFAMKIGKADSDTYILMSEYSLYAWCKPDNYNTK